MSSLFVLSIGNGDMELLSVLHKTVGICADPISIECREAGTHTAVQELTRRGLRVTCNHYEGLKCFNKPNQGKCVDFEIRVFCPCKCKSLSVDRSDISIESFQSHNKNTIRNL